jgi:hypothetical protein
LIGFVEDEPGEGVSQPLDFNSEEMRLRIMESGTRLPDCIAASASIPIGKQLALIDLLRMQFGHIDKIALTQWCPSANILS